MKKLILIPALLLGCGSALAFEDNDIGLIVKYGAAVNNDDNGRGGRTRAVVLSIMKDDCQNCFSPFIIHLDSENFEGRNLNDGIGADYVYKFQHPEKNGYYMSIGGALFTEPLNSYDANHFGYHAGIGMEAEGLVLSADVYNTGATDAPLYMLNIGYHF